MGSDTHEPSATELELYRLAVEMADRVSARRGTANSFFLAVHAAVITAVAALLPDRAGTPQPLDSTLITSAGMTLAATWWLLLRSYRHLNSAKFNVILKMESRLPVGAFGDEWQSLKKDPIGWRKGYAELGEVERIVPIVFFVLYALSLVVVWWR